MIKGLERRARYPRLGIIRLGIKVRNERGVEFPREVHYFVLPPGLGLERLFPDKPTTLPVMFPSNDIEQMVFPAFYTRYAGQLLAVRCDGETAINISKEGHRTTTACRKEPEKDCACGAKALGRLNVLLAHPEAAFGIFQIPIGGEQRIEDLLDELRIYRATLGKLTDIVFQLERIETIVQVPTDTKGRIPKKGWPVHVRCNFSALDAMRLRGVAALGLGKPGDVPALTTGETPDEIGEGDVIEAEAEETWDISLMFVKVATFGIEAATYTAYLSGVYRGGVDEMTGENMAEQERLVRAALTDLVERDKFVSAVHKVATAPAPRR